MDFRNSLSRDFEKRGVFDDVGEESFAFAVCRDRIIPELAEIRRHGDQPLANGVVEDDTILLSRPISFLSHLSQSP